MLAKLTSVCYITRYANGKNKTTNRELRQIPAGIRTCCHTQKGLRRLLTFSMASTIRESKSKISIIDSEVNNFCDYLQSALGYAPHTIESCRLYVLRFLEDQFSKYPSASIWDNLRLSDVNEFIVKSSKIMNRYSLQHVIGYLRSYLKYKFQQGCLKQMIHEQIDSPVVFRGEKIPKASSWTVIKEILLSIDRSTSCGCRNYAIILLAARYGLRSNEISFLRICDIKWREKRICIPQSKTKQTNVLPLSNDVAWAIIDYVEDFHRKAHSAPDEPRCPCRS